MYQADIVIIGAGAVGTSIARELSKYHIKVMVVDKRDDVGGDASKSNSSIICDGADCPPHTLESRLVQASRRMMDRLTRDLDIPFKVIGSIMPAITEEQLALLPGIYNDAYENNIFDAELVSPREVLELEPEINPSVLGGLYNPGEAVIDPFLYVVALAENAAENGVEFLLDAEVQGIIREGGKIAGVETTRGRIKTPRVINAAGLFCDSVAAMVDECDFTVKPRKGQFFILDKNTPCKVRHVVYPIPTPTSRGKLLLPTVHGNILVGPTAEDLDDKEDRRVTAEGLQGIEEDVKKLIPHIRIEDAITEYCGLRPNRIPEGFHIGLSKKTGGYLGISGIRSTGVSASQGIAKYVVKMLNDAGVDLRQKERFIAKRRGIVKFAEASRDAQAALVSENLLYGHVVCRCETVTEAEVVEAIRRPVGARTMDALKRRVRSGMGRCQGGFCGPHLLEILSRELQIPKDGVNKNLAGSYMVQGELRPKGGAVCGK
ncbi:MAG: NAD(P)/FAD-dependent oxidoreductase [Spirochaetaceae bacterium]|nr:NAD(P)/FAD-dependent oxidoreductase [Spirochaetaceae bacterium]